MRGGRFADVMQEDSEKTRGTLTFVRQQRKHQPRVDEYVAFRMKLRRLGAALAALQFGQHLARSKPLASSRSKPRTRAGERKMRTNSS